MLSTNVGMRQERQFDDPPNALVPNRVVANAIEPTPITPDHRPIRHLVVGRRRESGGSDAGRRLFIRQSAQRGRVDCWFSASFKHRLGRGLCRP
jgi:hypothetical protein